MVIDTRIRQEDEHEKVDVELEEDNATELVFVPDEPDFSPLQFLVENDSIIQGELMAMHGNIFEFEFNDLGSINPLDVLFDSSCCVDHLHLVRFRYTFFGVSNFRVKDRLKFKFMGFEDCAAKTYRKIRFVSDDGKVRCSFNYRAVRGPVL